jgi:hypothetical protein
MNKNLLIEEITRLQEMMGVKKNILNLITEAVTPGRGSFDFNSGVKAGIKSELQNAVEEWGENTAQLTRNGNKATFDELLEQGRILARNAGDTVDDANALYYLSKATGPEGYSNLLGRLSLVNRTAFDSEVNSIANSTLKTQFQNSLQSLFLTFPWETADATIIQNTKNALRMLSNDIESSSIDTNLKTQLKTYIKEQEQILDGATETSSATTTLRPGTDISVSSTAGKNVGDIEDLKNESVENLIAKIKTDPNFEKISRGFWNVIKGREQKFIEWIKLDLKSKSIGDLTLPQTEQKIKSELDRRINILKTSSKTSEREAGTKLESIARTFQAIKTLIKSLPTGGIIWGVLTVVVGFWMIASPAVTINNMSEGDPFIKALESYGVVDLVKDVKDLIGGDNNEDGFTKWCKTNNYTCVWAADGNPAVKVNGEQTFAEYGKNGWKLI